MGSAWDCVRATVPWAVAAFKGEEEVVCCEEAEADVADEEDDETRAPDDCPEFAPLPFDSGFGNEKTPQLASERITPPFRRMSDEEARTILRFVRRHCQRAPFHWRGEGYGGFMQWWKRLTPSLP